ncbi:glycosyltransferase family 2 protein [Polychaeton citri CBS 116435]|uniref:dolichyl-phosphate beta-glucosyltransferase n=1 Tax=Polychaeton citri CBS 116435 TaxID=1314669 RepID=A0A9P4Q8Q5_9PEZI|nr:glycosyltransferase family 2 protein [Polychaeton citri CBS 116435]
MDQAGSVPLWAWGVLGVVAAIGIIALAFTFSLVLAPTPRPPRSSERTYITVTANGSISKPTQLPTWYDNYAALKKMASEKQIPAEEAYQIGEAELFMTLVVPAYNEEERLEGMLEEAVEYLERQYGHHGTKSRSSSNGSLQARGHQVDQWRGWEILLVSDGSTDRTVETTLRFARTHQLGQAPSPSKGPWKGNAGTPTKILPGTIRVIQLEQNRGKGGAVTHGMRHARGRYIVFADADGASKFSDLGRLVEGCERVKDKQGRAVGVGSRAHMVGTEAVVKRSFLRNALMHSFHLLLHFMTTPQTAEIKDTQCGFKLFTRPSLPFIVPFMHSEGWIFDVEMLMLAESANIPMVEVPIGWKEVMGSKLNVIWDSLGMAWGLAILRVGWGTGFFKRE